MQCWSRPSWRCGRFGRRARLTCSPSPSPRSAAMSKPFSTVSCCCSQLCQAQATVRAMRVAHAGMDSQTRACMVGSCNDPIRRRGRSMHAVRYYTACAHVHRPPQVCRAAGCIPDGRHGSAWCRRGHQHGSAHGHPSVGSTPRSGPAAKDGAGGVRDPTGPPLWPRSLAIIRHRCMCQRLRGPAHTPKRTLLARPLSSHCSSACTCLPTGRVRKTGYRRTQWSWL